MRMRNFLRNGAQSSKETMVKVPASQLRALEQENDMLWKELNQALSMTQKAFLMKNDTLEEREGEIQRLEEDVDFYRFEYEVASKEQKRLQAEVLRLTSEMRRMEDEQELIRTSFEAERNARDYAEECLEVEREVRRDTEALRKDAEMRVRLTQGRLKRLQHMYQEQKDYWQQHNKFVVEKLMQDTPEAPTMGNVASRVAATVEEEERPLPIFARPPLRDRRISWTCGQAEVKRMMDVA